MGDRTTWRIEGPAADRTDRQHFSDGKPPPLKWARHSASGRIRYIRSLGVDERGAACGCECVHCGSQLQAVNAARDEAEIELTPHFRHPKGALREGCVVLTARHAALANLIESGEIHLPRRRVSATVVGLSGRTYEAWSEEPARRARFRNAQMLDYARALLTLDDGRSLVVELIGASGEMPATAGGALVEIDSEHVTLPGALVTVVVPAEFAILDPEEIVRRLTLLPDSSWCGHWNDQALAQRAKDEAQALAGDDSLAWLGDEADAALASLDPSLAGLSQPEVQRLRQETLLHVLAKRILADATNIRLPSLAVDAVRPLHDGTGDRLHHGWFRLPEVAELASVELERRLGRIVPDVLARRASPPQTPAPCNGADPTFAMVEDVLLIEVTVTNHIDDERLQRIQRVNLPTLEIDLSRLGGQITREALTKLVTEDLHGKRWLHHPVWGHAEAALMAQLDAEARPREERFSRRDQLLGQALTRSAEYWRSLYLQFVREHSDARAAAEPGQQNRMDIAAKLEKVRDAGLGLAAHGWPEAEDEDLFRGQGCPLDRLLSIQLDTCVGYRLKSAFEVMNVVLQEERTSRKSWHVVYILALKSFPRITTSRQQWQRLVEWTREVRSRIDSSDDPQRSHYLRSARYDRFVGFLFPQLVPGLERRVGVHGEAAARQPARA
jgi:hypothetical protein